MANIVPKTFDCDDEVLDPAIKKHISTLYAAVDKKETVPFWGEHFTEDAELKKGSVSIKGRESRTLPCTDQMYNKLR